MRKKQELEQIASQQKEQNTERINVRIPKNLREQIKERAGELGYMNTSEYVRGLMHRDIEQSGTGHWQQTKEYRELTKQ